MRPLAISLVATCMALIALGGWMLSQGFLAGFVGFGACSTQGACFMQAMPAEPGWLIAGFGLSVLGALFGGAGLAHAFGPTTPEAANDP